MFILFGFGKKTVKDFSVKGEIQCRRCNNTKNWAYKKVTTWFTLFFVPVIPYSTAYVRVCPICGEHDKLSKENFMSVVENNTIVDVDLKYDGMTETQANYMKEMAAIKSEQESSENVKEAQDG